MTRSYVKIWVSKMKIDYERLVPETDHRQIEQSKQGLINAHQQ